MIATHEEPTTEIKIVPNQFPSGKSNGLAIIGEAPGAEEDACGIPFSGKSGRLLNSTLERMGIKRHECFVGNVLQYRPANNDLTKVPLEHFESLFYGIPNLRMQLASFAPNLILLLGNTAIRAFLAGQVGIGKLGAKKSTGIGDVRGSLFKESESGCWCLCALHPAAILREWNQYPLFLHDIHRTAKVLNRGYTPPNRVTLANPPFHAALNALEEYQHRRLPIAFDIEGGVNGWQCFSISDRADTAFVIDWAVNDYSGPELVSLYRATVALLEDPLVPKILQNSLYDRFVLHYTYQIVVQGVVDDTMLKHWELYPEMEKSLGFQCSVYTEEPFYKNEIASPDRPTFRHYSGKDSMVTWEINDVLESKVRDGARSHYQFNRALLNPLLYMELRGFAYDSAEAQRRIQRLVLEEEVMERALHLYSGYSLEVASAKQMAKYLYEVKAYEPYYNRKTKRITTDEKSILRTIEKHLDDPTLKHILRLKKCKKTLQMLRAGVDPDGRVRCGYNAVGTETGRLTCYKSPTGSGYNLQTVPKELRILFRADPGCCLFQCDLSGADAWTVAAHCKALGDATMLEDLLRGIKIAKVMALLFLRGTVVNSWDRETLAKECRTVDSSQPIYFGSKCCQHATNYFAQPPTISDTIFKESDGEISIETATVKRLQGGYLLRYRGVHSYHEWGRQSLASRGSYTDASGHTRVFFGRREENDTLRQYLAHGPQANTTYATNLAAMRLWRDRDNRQDNGRLRLEPIHQIHDALVAQCKIEDKAWAKEKLHEYFNNPLTIAGTTLTIPFEMTCGSYWGGNDL